MSGRHAPTVMVGNPVTGIAFFDRETEMKELLALLASGAHVMVAAPRRIGKTSLLLEARERLGNTYAFLFVDVQACTTEIDGLVKLTVAASEHRDLGQRILDPFKNFFGKADGKLEEIGAAGVSIKLRAGLAADWQTKGNEVLERLAETGKPVVVWFDELPVLVSALLSGDDHQMTPERVGKTRIFMSWLREASIRHRNAIRFVISGSIGLEPLLSRAGISDTLNTFSSFKVRAWSHKIALEFVRSRTSDLELDAADAKHLLVKLGELIPHHVAKFVQALRIDAARRGATAITKQEVDRVYREEMLGVHGHVDLATYEDRLKRVVPPALFSAAIELLTETATVGRLDPKAADAIVRAHAASDAEAADGLRFLLQVFEHDGYLVSKGKGYVFVSKLVRDWWKGRFRFGYVPVAKRGSTSA